MDRIGWPINEDCPCAVMLLNLINVLFVLLLAAAPFILIISENMCTKTN